ncbi:MAG: mechanosensitive ion channel family protein [Deltaproteobacteria bacterium]|nr:mechanosensitive ion channel family protein [Deltaproteobacteria bacterium]
MTAMFKYERGLHGDINLLYELIEVPAGVKKDFRDNYLISAAERLYVILQNVDFDPEKDIPSDVAQDRTKVQIGRKDGLQVTFEMVKTSHGSWRFAAETVDDPRIKNLYSKIKTRYEKLSRADMEGDTFQQDLMSPYRTVRTLYNGVLGHGEYGLKDAVGTLDLLGMDQAVKKTLGPYVAVALYRILRFRSPLDMSQLSADPQSKRSPILLLDPKYGVVSLQVVKDPDSGLKQWKFTPISAQVAIDAYEEYMAKGLAKMLQEESSHLSGKNPPIKIQVDDWIWKHFPGLQIKTLGMAIWKWLLLLALLLATPIVVRLIRFFVTRSCRNLGSFESESVTCTHRSFILPLQIAAISVMWLQGIIIITTYLTLIKISSLLFHIMLAISVVWLSWVVIEFVALGIMGAGQTSAKGTVVLVISRILKIALVVFGLIYMASLFGQDSTRIVTALGIGGIALALAGKDTVENIFGTFMILSTRPFVIGDWIKVDNFEGTVENVGIRSTVLRTFHNSLVNVPNATFVKTPIDNMGKRSYRRYKTTLYIRYGTPPDLMVSFMEGVRELVRNHPHIRKDFHIIRLNDFTRSAFTILVYVFFKTTDWEAEMEERERFILDIIRLAELMGVRFAFPTQQLFMGREKALKNFLPEREEAIRLGREAASAVSRSHFESQ